MKNKILFITLLVFFNTAYISAEQKKSVISDNRGFAGSCKTFMDLNYKYNSTTVNYKDVINGPIVAENTYTSKNFSGYCYNSKGTRRITGNMKNSLRTGAWTSTSNETLDCTIYNDKHEEFTASGNYIEGLPDGEWKLKFKGNCMTYCNITAHFKKGVLLDINYEGKECSTKSPYIVKCKFNSEGFYHGKCTLVQSTIDEYTYDNGKLISYKSTEKGSGRVLEEKSYKIEDCFYDTIYTVDNDIFDKCLEQYGGNVLSDVSSTPGLLNMGIWCNRSIKGDDCTIYQGGFGQLDRDKIKAFRNYKRWDIRKLSVAMYFRAINEVYLADCLVDGIPPYFSPKYSYDMSADIYRANAEIIPVIEQFKKDVASASKSSDGEYYRVNNIFVKIEDSDMDRLDKLINDANASLAQYEIEVKARKDYEQTRQFIIAESKTFPDLVKETKQGYSGFFISTPDQVVVKDGMQEILNEFNAYKDKYELYRDYKYYSESNSKDLSEYKAFIDNAKAYISQKDSIDSNNSAIIAESKSYKNIQKAYTSIFAGYDLSWKSNKGTSKLQEVIDFQNGVLNTLKTNASDVNKSIKKVKDQNQQKSMIMGK